MGYRVIKYRSGRDAADMIEKAKQLLEDACEMLKESDMNERNDYRRMSRRDHWDDERMMRRDRWDEGSQSRYDY